MRKIPNLFLREGGQKLVSEHVNPECAWVLLNEGEASEKYDGTCCAVIRGRLYRRHRSRAAVPPRDWVHWSRTGLVPASALPPRCDGTTGHGWLLVDPRKAEDAYHAEALANFASLFGGPPPDGTYEMVGPKVQGNPYRLDSHRLWRHGAALDEPLVFEAATPPRDQVASFLRGHRPVEGVVWRHPLGPMAKAKRADLGLPWPAEGSAR